MNVLNSATPIFETHTQQPGIRKLWTLVTREIYPSDFVSVPLEHIVYT